MRLIVYLITLGLLTGLTSTSSLAQRRTKNYTNAKRPIKISRSKAKVICPIFEESGYPYQGFGVKVGDPLAFTYKMYASKNFGFAIDFGSAASGLYSKRHRENFADHDFQTDTTEAGDISGFRYRSHEVLNEYTIEAKFLYHSKADKLFPGLQSYVGLGVQFRKLAIQYEYVYEYGFGLLERDSFDSEKASLGPVVVGGLEYSYFKLPVSAFIEIEIFNDTINSKGWTRFQGGVGLRYIF